MCITDLCINILQYPLDCWRVNGFSVRLHERELAKKIQFSPPMKNMVQTGEATVENNMEFPQKTKNGTAL